MTSTDASADRPESDPEPPPATPLVPPPAPQPPARTLTEGLLLRGLNGNVFYLISVVLLLWGCKLLMKSPLLREIEIARVLYTFTVLQIYELLIMGSAALLVSRMGKLQDAFTLVLIALTLMFDPTFFSNNFLTIFNMENLVAGGALEPAGPGGVYTCLIATLLVPLKLLLLGRIAGFRMSRATLACLTLAGGLIYLGAFPFNLNAWRAAERVRYEYALAWSLPLMAALMPQVGTALWITRPLATPEQERWLRRGWVMIPLLLVAGHWAQHCHVYEIPMAPMMFGTLCLAAGALVWRQSNSPECIWALDAAVIAAVVLNLLPQFDAYVIRTLQDNDAAHISHATLRDLAQTRLPLLLAGLGAAGLYLLHWARWRSRAVLMRLGLVVVIGLIALAIKTGYTEKAATSFIDSLMRVSDWVRSNPVVFLWLVWAGWGIAAVRFREAGVWLWFAAYSWIMLLSLLPGSIFKWAPELFQGLLVLTLINSHRMQRNENAARLLIALLIASIAFGRYGYRQEPLHLWLAIGWSLCGLALALWRLWDYALIGAALALGLLSHAAVKADLVPPREIILIAGGIVMLAFGVLISIFKPALHARLEAIRAAQPAPQPPPIPAAALNAAAAPQEPDSGE